MVVNIVSLVDESRLHGIALFNIESWKRYGHAVQLINETQILSLMETESGEFKDLTHVYKRCSSWIARQELAKYIVAYIIGGTCVDTHAECKSSVLPTNESFCVHKFPECSLTKLFGDYDLIASTSFLYSPEPQSPLLHRLIFDDIMPYMDRIGCTSTGLEIICAIGPIALSKRIHLENIAINIIEDTTCKVDNHVAMSWFHDLEDAEDIAKEYINNRDKVHTVALASSTVGGLAMAVRYRRRVILTVVCMVIMLYCLYYLSKMYPSILVRYIKWKHSESLIAKMPYVYDDNDTRFQFLLPLKEHYHAIRDEAVHAMRSAPALDIVRSSGAWVQSGSFIRKHMDLYGWVTAWQTESDDANPDWQNYGIIFKGKFFEQNVAMCPALKACLEPIKSRINICGFSWMRPCTKIKRHTDTTGLRYQSLAYHLGLCVPEDVQNACKLVVGNVAVPEENGKAIIFDSSYKHYAENNACAERIILYIDFKL